MKGHAQLCGRVLHIAGNGWFLVDLGQVDPELEDLLAAPAEIAIRYSKVYFTH
jgi:hypothetical protein